MFPGGDGLPIGAFEAGARLTRRPADARIVAAPAADGASDGPPTPPRRGRPRREIDLEKVADAVERLFTEEGYDAVSIDRAAKELEVSRATLYRTVPSKEHLLAILFERMTEELHRAALVIVGDTQASPRERLMGLIEAQIEAAFRQREFLFVLFGGGWLPREFYARWLQWQEQYELVWRTAVTDAIAAGEIAGEDPVITTRLILGMTLWVSRWIRPAETYTADQIARATEELILPAIGHAAPTR